MLLGVPIESILTILAGAAIGFAAHVSLKVSEIREQQLAEPEPPRLMTPWRYFALHPYKTLAKALAVSGAVIAMVQPEVTPVLFGTAVGVGWAADSAVNRLPL